MANVLTSLAPVIYAPDKKMVPEELTGFLSAIRIDSSNQGQAKGDTVKVPVAPVMSISDVTPSQTFSAGADRTAASKNITLANFKEVSWNLTAEEERSLMNSGVAQDMFRQTLQQACRKIRNTVEANVAAAVYKGASRATGTAGTTPFASNLNDLTALRKILVDNGVDVNPAEVSLVMDTAAGVNLRNLTQLTKSLEAGTDKTLRAGVIGDLFGFAIRESGQIQSHTAGTGSGYLLNGALAVDATSITVDTGTGTILAGDVVTFAGTSHKYVVNSALASNVFTIGDPGSKAIEADNDAVTVGAAYTANVALHRNAGVLVCRPALQPAGGIAEQMLYTDPVSGITCLMLRVPGNAMASYFLRVVYDSSMINSHAAAVLLG